MPSVGRFAATQVIALAGVDPKKIYTSDISLFSTALGYYLVDKSLDSMDIVMEEVPYDLSKYETIKEQVAEICLCLKWCQLKPTSYYNRSVRKEMELNHDKYHKNVVAQLEEHYKLLHGIDYQIADMRDEIKKYKDNENTMMLITPPATSADRYASIDEFKQNLMWDEPSIEKFELQDFTPMLDELKNTKATIMVDMAFEEVPDSWNKLFAEYRGEETWRLIINKKLPDNYVERPKMKMVKANWKLYNEEKITKHSKIQLTKIRADEAYYYRDLFIHKLGSTGADITVAFTIEGSLLAVCGFAPDMLYGRPSSGEKSDGRLHEKDYLYQLFGLTIPSKTYPRLGRLLAYFVTCRQFKEEIERIEPSLKMVNMNAMRSSALTKAPEQRLVHGLMKRISKEKMPNQMFQLVYHTDFHDRSYKECIIKWLDELRREEAMELKNERKG